MARLASRRIVSASTGATVLWTLSLTPPDYLTRCLQRNLEDLVFTLHTDCALPSLPPHVVDNLLLVLLAALAEHHLPASKPSFDVHGAPMQAALQAADLSPSMFQNLLERLL